MFWRPVGKFFAWLITSLPRREGEGEVYDPNRAYYLPYEGNMFLVQGYDGGLSHSDDFALDWVMEIGTPVLAARTGNVTFVEDSYNDLCPISRSCRGNGIVVAHEDETFAYYWHIKQDGVCVSIGQSVERGDVIGLSGDVGISYGPHLHFEIVGTDTEPTFADVESNGGVPQTYRYYTSANTVGVDYCSNT